jgi:hypothetical protein
MRKLIFTGLILGLSLNIYAAQVGESQKLNCTESDQSSRSQEQIKVEANSSADQSNKTKNAER